MLVSRKASLPHGPLPTIRQNLGGPFIAPLFARTAFASAINRMPFHRTYPTLFCLILSEAGLLTPKTIFMDKTKKAGKGLTEKRATRWRE
jgi:hypothetical protein